MEITKDMQIVIDYCIENNIKYKVCEYVAGKQSGYTVGKTVQVLYLNVNILELINIKSKFDDVRGFVVTDYKSEKTVAKSITKGFHSLLR